MASGHTGMPAGVLSGRDLGDVLTGLRTVRTLVGGDVVATDTAARQLSSVLAATSVLGRPYEWGAVGPDRFDCSGLTSWAYRQAGGHRAPATSSRSRRCGPPACSVRLAPPPAADLPSPWHTGRSPGAA